MKPHSKYLFMGCLLILASFILVAYRYSIRTSLHLPTQQLTCSTNFDMWHDYTYHLHKDEKLPLLPHEYEYYSQGILNSDELHHYPSLKSLIESNCDENRGKSLIEIWSTDDNEFTLLSFEFLSKPSNSHLKRIFFSQLTSALDTSQSNGKFKHDFHEDETIYSIIFNPTTKRYEISKKLPTLLVHMVFAHNVEFRDDFVSYPIVSEESRRKYCPNNCQNHLCSICEESTIKKNESKVFFSRPWCFKPNLNFGILSIEDGIYDFGVSNRHVTGSLFDKNGNILIMSTPHSLKFDYQASVKFEPMFAMVGVSYNPTAAGHFPIEVLPRIVFMSYFLPLHIPILMNDIGKNRRIIESFKELGIIHPKRKIIWARVGHYYIGKRVYFLHSKDDYAALTPDIVMRIVSTIYSKFFKKLPNPIQQNPREYILVVDRSDIGNRMITNQDEMINSLKEFTTPLNIDIFLSN
ncbi:predicted protein [Naegleria gruberi]|uniref:Predicted protein n=1 Tax=Naegleria gruberi TaxID=5762 RepID=D2VC54_NAEGR|nr:uncharacterized protein NAEGRDRAFT_66452 [Naegleria gruberi]EFC45688.1 predicted protein [Naegleria gruberi]|eukprot:XP_002678432.1 predicted protein [Naegleria gruberi strain NEG-M]